MIIKILGPGCAKCKEVEALVRKIVADAGVTASVEKVTDLKEMMRLGVMSTPAVVVDDIVKCTGRAPTTCEVKHWIGVE